MPLTTLASEFFKKIEQHHWHEVSDFLAADFMYYGPEPEPINQSVWLDLIESLVIAFPDWSFHLLGLTPLTHDQVQAKVHITGTHTVTLDLTMLGFKPIPPSGLRLDIPDEEVTLAFDGDKIITMKAGNKIHDSLMQMFSLLEMD